MKQTGIIRPLDHLGRIVLPKELRKTFELSPEDFLEIYVDGDRIILQKYEPTCTFCGNTQETVEVKGKRICKKCLEEIKSF